MWNLLKIFVSHGWGFKAYPLVSIFCFLSSSPSTSSVNGAAFASVSFTSPVCCPSVLQAAAKSTAARNCEVEKRVLFVHKVVVCVFQTQQKASNPLPHYLYLIQISHRTCLITADSLESCESLLRIRISKTSWNVLPADGHMSGIPYWLVMYLQTYQLLLLLQTSQTHEHTVIYQSECWCLSYSERKKPHVEMEMKWTSWTPSSPFRQWPLNIVRR